MGGFAMTPELVALAHRAVACKGWRWMPGMMRRRVTPSQMRDHLRREGRVPEQFDNWAYDDWSVVPDFTDPATLGCLLALVREAWDDPYLCCVGDRETGWRLDGYAAVEDIHSYGSEAEALVSALLAR